MCNRIFFLPEKKQSVDFANGGSDGFWSALDDFFSETGRICRLKKNVYIYIVRAIGRRFAERLVLVDVIMASEQYTERVFDFTQAPLLRTVDS